MAIDALQLSGNSSIIDLFETCAPNSTDLIGPLINTLNGSVLQNERLTIDAQMKLTFETIDRFFEQNPTLKAECQNEQLGNGLDLHEFMEIGRMASLKLRFLIVVLFSSSKVLKLRDCLKEINRN